MGGDILLWTADHLTQMFSFLIICDSPTSVINVVQSQKDFPNRQTVNLVIN